MMLICDNWRKALIPKRDVQKPSYDEPVKYRKTLILESFLEFFRVVVASALEASNAEVGQVIAG